MLADETFAKDLRIRENGVLANNNLDGKIASSSQSVTTFDEIFKATWVPSFVPHIYLLIYKFGN